MENNPLVSVIMNCYNSDEFLKESIESVLNQTYKNFEIIFWDNRSTDNSANIIKAYDDKRIQYFYAPIFTPLGKARNLAIEKTNGDWIAFLDCDDYWTKEKLQLSFLELSYIKNKEEISLIYSKSVVVDKNGKKIRDENKSMSGYIHDKLLVEGDFIIFSSIVVKKEILNQVENINEELNYCEDFDLLLKISKNYKAIGINESLTYYRMHDNNITSTKIYENNIEVVEMLNQYIKDNHFPLDLKYHIFMNNSYRLGSLFVKLLLKKEFYNSIKILKKNLNYFLIFPIAILKEKFR